MSHLFDDGSSNIVLHSGVNHQPCQSVQIFSWINLCVRSFHLTDVEWAIHTINTKTIPVCVLSEEKS